MQKRKYFLRRFRQYLLLFLLPAALVFLISLEVSIARFTKSQDEAGRDLVRAVNTDLDLSLNNITQQNVQFANNPYMVLSLKRILEKGTNLSYAESINLRSLNASLKSTVTTYPYVKNICLYLDGYDYCYTSRRGIEPVSGTEEWLRYYREMGEQDTDIFVLPSDDNEQKEAKKLTILQKMPFFSGVVVIQVDVNKFKTLLDGAIPRNDSTVVFLNMQNEKLFAWGDGENTLELMKYSLPGNGKKGIWEEVGSRKYLLHRSDNQSFRIRIVSMTPLEAVVRQTRSFLPSGLLMLAAGLAAALIAAYITTARNFGHIAHIISVLGEAERGVYPAKADPRRPADEYDAILNNIIRLHLETERLNSELEQKKHLQEVASLSALQAQINPHFMFNTLQMIQFKAAEQTSETNDVVRMTADLADILKYALTDPLQPITLEEEIGYLKKYIAIQHLRFGERFIIYYEVDETLLQTPVFRLMLQPIIENSILHGIRYREGTGYIKLTVFEREGVIYFRVFDTGAGMSAEKLRELRENINTFNVRNIGLANVNNRLKLYFGDEAGLKICSIEGQGTIVKFEIPEDKMQKYVTKSKIM